MSIAQHYDLLRGLHILAVIAWMAGLLYLPRLYAYHAVASVGSEMDATFQVMEVKLLRIIMTPAMIASLVFGALLIWADIEIRGPRFLLEPWVLTKLGGVIFLLGWHGFLASARRAFVEGNNQRSGKFWRMSNELPFIAAVVMVLAVTLEFGN